MATLPVTHTEDSEKKLTMDEAAAELYKIVESHFDDLDLTEAERDVRYASAREFLDANASSSAKA